MLFNVKGGEERGLFGRIKAIEEKIIYTPENVIFSYLFFRKIKQPKIYIFYLIYIV